MGETFEILEHTADAGIRAFGRALPELYANAARGMLHLMFDLASVRAADEEEVEVEGADEVDLMVAWLHEIVFRFDAYKRVFADVRVDAFSEWRLRATLMGEPLDSARHELLAEIKAVTYHRARVEREGSRWVAEVFFDV